MNAVFSGSSFTKAFSVWKPLFESHLKQKNPDEVIALGSRLSHIFKSNNVGERTQKTVSGGGAAWEGLVCWYLNLCMVGSRAIVIKQNARLLPASIRYAIRVNYGSFPSNTESDLLVIIVRKGLIESLNQETATLENLFQAISDNMDEVQVGIIQCKTNWNDNAQIPMLWDMVYSAVQFERGITLGSQGHSIKDFRRFTYSFVTVPSGSEEYNPRSTAVQRVRNLSGGNYWGKPTSSGVAKNISEILTDNFREGWDGNIRTTLSAELKNTENIKQIFRL